MSAPDDAFMSTKENHQTNEAAISTPGIESELVTKRAVAKAANVSVRTIDTWQKQKLIPCVKLSPRCVRYHLPSVLKALQRFTVEAAA